MYKVSASTLVDESAKRVIRFVAVEQLEMYAVQFFFFKVITLNV